jgi:hypothetical protein
MKFKQNYKHINHDLTVVIRSSGERTLDLCYSLVRKQVKEQNIIIIEEKPFSKAVLKNFEIGIERGTEYTLSIDADILIFNDAIAFLLNNFEKLDKTYFVYQGLVFDKFFNSYRAGGPHLYRTSLLKKAIEFIPKEGTSLRPESSTYIEMKKIGYHTYQDIWAVGIHDDEQYYEDIYRKFFLHAHKHKSRISKWIGSWDKNWVDDLDYQMALKGLSDGLLFKEQVFVDSNFLKNYFLNAQQQFKIVEKTKEITLKTSLDKRPFLIGDSSEFFDSKKPFKKKEISIINKIKYKTGVQFENWANYLKKY